MINQLTRKYKCIKNKLLRYFPRETRLLSKFDYVDFEHVY